MRVLNTYTGQFDVIDPDKTDYAILSHTWDRDGEQTYQALVTIQKRYQNRARRWWRIAQRAATGLPSNAKRLRHRNHSSPIPASSHLESPPSLSPAKPVTLASGSFLHASSGQRPLSPIWGDPKLSPKVREACRIARENGYEYLWIDSCCIDQTSSSELSESINSMYQWYARAHVCYAFLPDVPAEEDHRRRRSHFRESRWFSRGWTLQELIAPVDVQFLSMEWAFIGSKESFADLVVEVTNINHNALLHIEPLDNFSVAQRLSWAAKRETTRAEDRAYSLLGIFDINMPTLYGEGNRAFRRLQEEIMRRTPDQSLFAWTQFRVLDRASPLYDTSATHPPVKLWKESMPVLAPSLDVFGGCTGVEALSQDEVAHRLQLQPNDLPPRYYDFTPYGIRTQFPLIPISDYFPAERIENNTDVPLSQWCLVVLGCGHKDFPGRLLGRVCYMRSSSASVEFVGSGWIDIDSGPDLELLPLSPASLARLGPSQISMKSLYIPQPDRDQGADDLAQRKRHETIKFVLPDKTREALSLQGYTAALRKPDDAHPRTHSVTLSHDTGTHTITIDYQYALEERGGGRQYLTVGAYVKASGLVLRDFPTPDGRQVLQLVDSGLGTRVLWQDSMRWHKEHYVEEVRLNFPGSPTVLTVRIGLTLATMNHYLLRIEVKNPASSPS